MMRKRPKDEKQKQRLNPLKTAIAQRDSDILGMVDRALRHKEVMLAYQPIVLAGNPQRLAFYEGLIRVMDETGRIIPARDFIQVIMPTGLGRVVDRLSLEFGLRALARTADLRLAINLSAEALDDPRWHDVLNHGLSRNDTVAERLILEITEDSVMANPDRVIGIMDELQLRGISFALDDFGAGQTAIRYFKDFAFDILKIDGSFIRGIDQSADNQAITRALVSIGQHFEMFTVAEHVESPAEAAFLAEIGVDCLQGYLYGAPTITPPWHAARDTKRHA